MLTLLVADRLRPGLSEARKRQLYEEHVRWYRLYGMSMRPVPGSWAQFQECWEHMCGQVLEANEPARAVLEIRHLAKSPLLRVMPDWSWSLLWRPQARLGYGWARSDERRLGLLCAVVRDGGSGLVE